MSPWITFRATESATIMLERPASHCCGTDASTDTIYTVVDVGVVGYLLTYLLTYLLLVDGGINGKWLEIL